MICPKCGQENPNEAKFCGKCAAALTGAVLTGFPPAPAIAGEAVPSGLNVGIIIGTVIIPLLGIVMGLIYMNDPNPRKKAAGRIWLYIGIGMFVLYCLCGLASMLGGGGGFNY